MKQSASLEGPTLTRWSCVLGVLESGYRRMAAIRQTCGPPPPLPMSVSVEMDMLPRDRDGPPLTNDVMALHSTLI